MKRQLCESGDFRRVYAQGSRFDALSLTAFVLPNELPHHRLGVTASRKAVGNAVQRNRAKRVLREAFRLSDASLQRLRKNYDWVLNAKGRLLSSTTTVAIAELEEIFSSVANRETDNDGLQVA